MIRATREVTIGGEVRTQVRELSVAEARAWFQDMAQAERDLVGELLFDDISLAELRRMTDLTREKVDALTPSELRQIIDVAKELNPDFFAMRARLASVGIELARPSNEPSAH